MKVKLLKKVRKRFVINRIDSLSNASMREGDRLDVDFAKRNGFPFYEVFDKEDGFGYSYELFKTEIEAKEELIAQIISCYRRYYNKKDNKTKIWHTNS